MSPPASRLSGRPEHALGRPSGDVGLDARRGRRRAFAAETALPQAFRPSPSSAASPAWRAESSTMMSASLPGSSVPTRSPIDSASALPARELPERGQRIELLAVQRDHLVALVHGPQHGIAGAAADIGRRGDPERLRAPAVALVVEQAGAEEQVGGRTEHRDRVRRPTAHRPRVGKMDAVAEQALAAEQPVMLVDVGIVAATRDRAPASGRSRRDSPTDASACGSPDVRAPARRPSPSARATR